MTGLERYRRALDDGDALAAAHDALRPPTALAHPRRVTRDDLAALLDGATPSPASPWALRWPTERPGHHWAHAAGLFHVMEEASLLPVALLDVRPGHRVLDACAAPGGKAARLALALRGQGLLVANDRRAARHRATSSLVRRLGLATVTTTVGDATRLLGIGTFDRVLVDAPCTAETQRSRPVDAAFRDAITRVQRALLDRAIAQCRPGGRVVYSTCTYAPEENEAVVDHALRRGGVTVAAVEAGELRTSPGFVDFEAHAFDGSLAQAHRLWPHRSATGGFFAAALDKAGDAPCEVGPVSAEEADPACWNALRERFGLPSLEALGLRLQALGASLRLVPVDACPLTPARHVEVASAGLVLVRRRDRSAKLTTEAAMRLGRRATRHLVHLDAEQRDHYLARRTVALAPPQRQNADGGYVIVRHGAHALGMGMLRGQTLVSEFPKAWALDHGFAARARSSSSRKNG